MSKSRIWQSAWCAALALGLSPLAAANLMPAVTVVTAPQVNSGEFVDKGVVRLAGVVSSALRDDTDENYSWIIVRTPQGKVCTAVAERVWPLARLRELRDAEVEIDGVVRPMVSWRKFLGCLLVIGDRKGLRVTKPPPADPYSGPGLTTDAEPHRQTVVGTVLARTARRFFVRRADGEFLPVTPTEELPMPPTGAYGQSICVEGEVTGFDSSGRGMLFCKLDGTLALALHQPNNPPNERPRFFDIEASGGSLRIRSNADK